MELIKVYLIESQTDAPVATKTRDLARAFLRRDGFTQRQPDLDPDPNIECWWKGDELVRIIPVVLY